jgi:hypothetical protein
VQRAAAVPAAQAVAPASVTAAPAGPLVQPAAPPTPAAVAESTSSPLPDAAARPDNPRTDETPADVGEPIATTLMPRPTEQSSGGSKPAPERPTLRDAAARPVFETPRFNWPPSPTADPGASAIQTVSQLPAPRPPEIDAPAVTTAALPVPIDPAALPDNAVAAARPPGASAAAAAPADIVRSQARDEDLVRGVLQQYRLAYEHLDARSAQAVWPRVDGTALQRAFEELASQRLTFDACDVQVRSSTGTAVCRGSARYVPKVGSREPRVEPRVWTFALRKVGEDWRIDTARAEQ